MSTRSIMTAPDETARGHGRGHPRTGQRREVRQPLKIDKLPSETRDEIRRLREQGNTWMEIEELSAEFVPWATLPVSVLALFPRRRVPHSALHRWYDIRIEQPRSIDAQILARAVADLLVPHFARLHKSIAALMGKKR